MSAMTYTEKLNAWFQAEKAAGRVVDVKFFPGVELDGSIEKLSQAAFETVDGTRVIKKIDVNDY
jgi:hypothetical protein